MTVRNRFRHKDALDIRRTAPAEAAWQNRWAVILAGGDGTRLQGLTRHICGDERPKQFCPLIGGQTLLAQTIRRAAMIAPSEQTLFALTRAHRKFFTPELQGLERRRVVQPGNRGTAPPILFSIRSIAAMDANAIVAVLPSDHHYTDEDKFTRAMESAFAAAAAHPESVVLLGVQPDRLELEYGWIELGPSVSRETAIVHRVQGFWEKPPLNIAEWLMSIESVWNTFVMVGRAQAFLDLSARTVPQLLTALTDVRPWTGSEMHLGEELYDAIQPCDFSKHILSKDASRLMVHRVRDLGWSDLGQPGRVIETVRKMGGAAPWVESWARRKESSLRLSPQGAVA